MNMETKTETKEKDRSLVVLDFENVDVGMRKVGKKWINRLNKWLNWEFKPSEKVVFLDSQRVNGHRHLLSKLNWTIQDVVTTDIGMNGEIEYVKNAADMELAMFTLDYAHRFGVDKVVLISGDGDYARLITYLKRLHVEVEAVSLLKSLSPKINEAADEVHYLDHILGLLENEAILSVRSDSIMVEEECSNGQ
jgi:uncharacterized LabA/DUF88 family protein